MITLEEIEALRVRAKDAAAQTTGDIVMDCIHNLVRVAPDKLLEVLDAAECGARLAAEFQITKVWTEDDLFKELEHPGSMKDERDAARAALTETLAALEKLIDSCRELALGEATWGEFKGATEDAADVLDPTRPKRTVLIAGVTMTSALAEEVVVLKKWLQEACPTAVLTFGAADYGCEWLGGKAWPIGTSLKDLSADLADAKREAADAASLRLKFANSQVELAQASAQLEIHTAMKEDAEKLYAVEAVLVTALGDAMRELYVQGAKTAGDACAAAIATASSRARELLAPLNTLRELLSAECPGDPGEPCGRTYRFAHPGCNACEVQERKVHEALLALEKSAPKDTDTGYDPIRDEKRLYMAEEWMEHMRQGMDAMLLKDPPKDMSPRTFSDWHNMFIRFMSW